MLPDWFHTPVRLFFHFGVWFLDIIQRLLYSPGALLQILNQRVKFSRTTAILDLLGSRPIDPGPVVLPY